MKLHALPLLYRQGQLNKVRTDESDVADLLELPSEVSERIWSKLADTLLESDLDELRTIVAGIAAKIAEAGKRFSSGDDA